MMSQQGISEFHIGLCQNNRILAYLRGSPVGSSSTVGEAQAPDRQLLLTPSLLLLLSPPAFWSPSLLCACTHSSAMLKTKVLLTSKNIYTTCKAACVHSNNCRSMKRDSDDTKQREDVPHLSTIKHSQTRPPPQSCLRNPQNNEDTIVPLF